MLLQKLIGIPTNILLQCMLIDVSTSDITTLAVNADNLLLFRPANAYVISSVTRSMRIAISKRAVELGRYRLRCARQPG